MHRPLIGVSSRLRQPGEVSGWPTTQAAVMQYTYLESLWRAGCDEALLAPRSIDVADAGRVLERLDGLVLVGGGDVDPQRYGQQRHSSVYGVEAESDSLELALATAAYAMGLPLLAICRGMQVLNVALGGTLHQHITRQGSFDEHGDPREGYATHSVVVEPGSVLAKAVNGASTIERCWSFHHQSIDHLGDGLVVSGRTTDGCIEAVERSNPQAGWLLGVQWHPERRSHEDAMQQAVFDELAAHARH